MSDVTQQVSARRDGGERVAAFAPQHAVASEKFQVFRDLNDPDRMLWIAADSVDPSTLRRRAGVSPTAAAALRQRVDAMLAAPIGEAGPPDFPAIVWPLEALVVDNTTIGFVTAVVSHEHAVSFDAASRARWPYDQRLRVARFLADTMSRAHDARHWLTGLDPSTIFVRTTGEISISDCMQVRPWDAKAKRNVNGSLPPPGLRAPEVKRRSEDVDETQDRYALAVLIYQMLADGALPVSSAGRYAHDGAGVDGGWYGRWPADLRDLFDRALGAKAKRKDRPSAADWAAALGDVLQRARICDAKPLEHGAAILSADQGCAMCALANVTPVRAPPRAASAAGAATGSAEGPRFSVEDLPPLPFSVRAADPAPIPAAASVEHFTPAAMPGAARAEMDASAPEFLAQSRETPRLFHWRVAGVIAAIALVAAGAVAVVAYFVTPPGRLLAEGAAPAVIAGEAPMENLTDERMAVSPVSIGEPVLNEAMLASTSSGYADIEFTVRNDGTASGARIAGESAPNFGYGDEALRLVSSATWPTRWQSRSAPYPARHRVIFPPGQTAVSQAPQLIVAPVYMARPQYNPQILAYGRSANVTLAVHVNAQGGVENARVVRNDSQNQAIAQEAVRLAMSARYPPDSSNTGYDTQLDVNFEMSPSEPTDLKPGAGAPGQLVLLADLPIERRPDARAFARHYPERAARSGTEGRAVLLCTVQNNGRFDCVAEEEDPPGSGFGDAAIRISRDFLVARQYPDGRLTAGDQVRVPISFRLG